MTDKSKEELSNETIKELDNICEECKKEDESVAVLFDLVRLRQ